MDIIQYIEQFRTKKGEPYTHTGMSNPMGCFNIPDDRMKEFISTCHDNIFKLKKKISITEKHLKTHSPALYDIDLRYPLKENKDENIRQYTSDHIEKMVLKINSLMSEYLEIPEEKIKAYVFERDNPYEFKGSIKDGVHIIYPEVVTEYPVQFCIRKKLIEWAKEISLFGDITITNDYDDVFDYSIIEKNPWLMYGCCKPNCLPYKLTSIINHEGEELDNEYSNLKLMSLLSIRNKTHTYPVKSDKKVEMNIANVIMRK